ncbi:hypothetical protein CLV79_10226 [Limimaricola soesokkakensis]|uniref:Uncharacterized protein n=1 Tax=Limimaricola soesokkakensis TaxID=1343159 RepID=A0A1X6YUG1_9RHOB|nr:hypothetical protein [Limimaricola soesokkakensis]PSK87547.1 hypothetical protein CLV79_10226 [Limimaricola soesokkakensis]SLN30960.1 hypothetical protein LOS8367_01110 [Limimaricola soesokkakensis]
MMGYEPLLTLVSAIFTAGVLVYLWYVVRSGARKRGNPELAAKAMREPPFHRLLDLGLEETLHLKKNPANAQRLQASITQLNAGAGASEGTGTAHEKRKGLLNLLPGWEPLPDDDRT